MRSGGRRCRAPASQSPAGRLCSTQLQPVALQPRRDFARRGVGEQELDRAEAGLRGALEAIEEGMLGEEHGQVGGERGMFFMVRPRSVKSSKSGQFRAPGRPPGAGRAMAGDRLELVDLVDLGAHRDVGHLLEDHLHHHRHLGALRDPFASASGWPIDLGSVTRIALQPRPSTTLVVDAVAR